MGTSGAVQAYMTGKGKVVTRAVTDIEAMNNGKHRIVVTELPYLVNKANLIQKIAELVKNKKIEGITDLRDESDREGMRVVIELRHDANPNIVLNRLFKHTQMQDSFGVIMLALVDGRPRVLNLKEVLHYYIAHQKDVITRLKQMVERLQQYGYKPVIYSNQHGYSAYYQSSLKHIDLWLASITDPDIIRKSHKHTIQQYNQWGYLKGIKGHVDLNCFIGSETEWNQWLSNK